MSDKNFGYENKELETFLRESGILYRVRTFMGVRMVKIGDNVRIISSEQEISVATNSGWHYFPNYKTSFKGILEIIKNELNTIQENK